MRLLSVKTELRNLSRGLRIAFVGLFTHLTKVFFNVMMAHRRM